MKINLKKLIYRQQLAVSIQNLIIALDPRIYIQDTTGVVLIGEENHNSRFKYSIEAGDDVIGWVIGSEKALSVAKMLSYMATMEFEKKTLAIEMLDKYEEINLLYEMSGKIANCLGIEEISDLAIGEALELIAATNASLMLLNKETGSLEIVSARGPEASKKIIMEPGQGIAGHVLLSEKAEIVNDVLSDYRFIEQKERKMRSLICAPLTTQNGTIGVINISNSTPTNYTAQDLKLFAAIASQTAPAIENALLHESKLKEERIKTNLERYLSPQIVQAAIETDGKIPLNPTKQNIAILFSDIRNFTATCETLAPEEIVKYLNEYFTQMVEVIFSHQGTVNKFVGDMIVAMFGAPLKVVDCERKAIEAAIAMQRQLQTRSAPWIRENFPTGIGISSGDVVVGNIGSPLHTDYTAIGDRVNIASRLQSMAKGGQILCSKSVYTVTRDIFEFKKVGRVKVKGRKQAVEIFEVVYRIE